MVDLKNAIFEAKKYNPQRLVIVFISIALMLVFGVFLIRHHTAFIENNKQQFRFAFKELTAQVERVITYVESRVQGMQNEASSYYSGSDQGDEANTFPVFHWFQYNTKEDMFHLDNVAKHIDVDTIGNLTGNGSLDKRNREFVRELEMAFSLNKHFRTNYLAFEKSSRIYYLSASEFLNIYPWISSNKFRFSKQQFKYESFIQNLPDNNPSRKPIWTKIHYSDFEKGNVISCVAPVYSQERFLGVVAIDFKLGFFSDLIKLFNTWKGHAILMNSEYQLIAESPKKSDSSPLPIEFKNDLPSTLDFQNTEIVFHTEKHLHEIDSFYSIKAKLNDTGWTLLYFEPSVSFQNYAIDFLGFESVIILIGIIGLVVLVSRGAYHYYTSPLVDISSGKNSSLKSSNVIRIPSEWLSYVSAMQEKLKKEESDDENLRVVNNDLKAILQAKTDELNEKSTLLSGLIYSIPDMIFFKNLDGQYIAGNQAFADFLQKDLDDIIGQTNEQLFPEKRTEFFTMMDKRAIDEKSLIRLEEWVENDKGDRILLDTIKSPIYNIEGEITGLVGVSRNITKIKEAEDQLNKSKEEAEAASRASSEFIANMSHELRTPLNAVIGCSELLSTMCKGEKERSYIETIQTSGKSLLTLINDILDLSKAKSGKIEIKPTPVNLRLILDEIKQIFTLDIDNKDLQFIIDVNKNVPSFIIADETRLRQVLVNLISNAIKFTPEGYVKAIARISRQNRGRTLEIVVEDSGIGISFENQERIFDSFSQSKDQSHKEYGGTGLGLSICKRLVEIMGGSLSLTSLPGEGSSFILTLNNVEIGSIDSPSGDTSSFQVPQTKFKAGKVLIVDDVKSNLTLLAEILGFQNLETASALNGKEALLLADEYRPDLIILDIMMPVMDGYETIERLKASDKTKDIPVIALTAFLGETDIPKLKKMGFESCLLKPLNTDQLNEELGKHFLALPGSDATLGSNNPTDNDEIDNSSRLAKLIEILEAEYYAKYKSLKGFGKMSAVKDFSLNLKTLAAEYTCIQLDEFADKLRRASDSFNVDVIIKSLDDFPSLIEHIREQSEQK